MKARHGPNAELLLLGILINAVVLDVPRDTEAGIVAEPVTTNF